MLDTNETEAIQTVEELSDFQRAGWHLLFGDNENVDVATLKSEFLKGVADMGLTVKQFMSPFGGVSREVYGDGGRSSKIRGDETLTMVVNEENFTVSNTTTRSVADCPLTASPKLEDFSRTTEGYLTVVKEDGSTLCQVPLLVDTDLSR